MTYVWRHWMTFSLLIYLQQNRDLQQRLDASAGIISSLESRIRELSNVPGMNLQALLQQLREGNASELRRLDQSSYFVYSLSTTIL